MVGHAIFASYSVKFIQQASFCGTHSQNEKKATGVHQRRACQQLTDGLPFIWPKIKIGTHGVHSRTCNFCIIFCQVYSTFQLLWNPQPKRKKSEWGSSKGGLSTFNRQLDDRLGVKHSVTGVLNNFYQFYPSFDVLVL